jgi:hypothetical protein
MLYVEVVSLLPCVPSKKPNNKTWHTLYIEHEEDAHLILWSDEHSLYRNMELDPTLLTFVVLFGIFIKVIIFKDVYRFLK